MKKENHTAHLHLMKLVNQWTLRPYPPGLGWDPTYWHQTSFSIPGDHSVSNLFGR